jgi:hypothetical protein
LSTDCSNFSELVWPRQKEEGPEVRCDFFKGSQEREENVKGNSQEKRGDEDGQEEGGQGKSKMLKLVLKHLVVISLFLLILLITWHRLDIIT